MQALTQLAIAINSAGLSLYFRETLWSDYKYTCRWINAGDFTENSTLLNGATLELEAYERDSL